MFLSCFYYFSSNVHYYTTLLITCQLLFFTFYDNILPYFYDSYLNRYNPFYLRYLWGKETDKSMYWNIHSLFFRHIVYIFIIFYTICVLFLFFFIISKIFIQISIEIFFYLFYSIFIRRLFRKHSSHISSGFQIWPLAMADMNLWEFFSFICDS